MSDGKNRIAGFDAMRALAIVAVVIIHVLPTELYSQITPAEISFYRIIRNLMNFAVPVFVMITGALMIERAESFKKSFGRAMRFLLCLGFFGFFMALTERMFKEGLCVKAVLLSVLDVISSETWDVTWYLYMVIGLYLLMPFISGFAKNADDKTLIYVLSLLFVFNSVIYRINALVFKTGFYLPSESIYLFYALAGYYFFNRQRKKYSKKILFIVLCIVAAFEIAFEFIVGMVIGKYINFTYNSPVTCVLAIVVFLLLKDVSKIGFVVKGIAENSFSIYLVHCFFIKFAVFLLGIYNDVRLHFVRFAAMFVCVFLISLAVSLLLRKIPLIKKLL